MGGPQTQTELRVVGRYELLTRIAKGGMGSVYLARMRGIGGFSRDVALKLVHEHLDQDVAQVALLEEAKIAARLRHPNAVPVLDVGEDEGLTYIVMDYVEGDSLAGLIRAAPRVLGGPLPLAISLRAILDSLSGLHAAHELVGEDGNPLGLVHRDYSPQNVLVGADGITRLTDFGIAKRRSDEVTHSGIVKGKIRYMSPEQARGERLDRRCDVWAAGVVLWELLAGRKLFAGDTDANILLRIVSEKPPLLREVAPNVHPLLEAAVAGALEKDLSLRTSTALALRKDLARAIREADLLTEPEDIATIVNRIAGPAIAERRSRLAALRQPSAAPPSATGTRRSRPDTGEVVSGEVAVIAPPPAERPQPSAPFGAPFAMQPPAPEPPNGVPHSDPRPEASNRSLVLVAAACVTMVAIGAALILMSIRRAAPQSASTSGETAAVTATTAAPEVSAVPSGAPAPTIAAVTQEEPATHAATTATTAPVAARPLPPPGRPPAAGGDGLAPSPYRRKK